MTEIRLPDGRRATVVKGLRARSENPIVNWIVVLLASLFAGLMLTVIISIAIWPGEAKLLAPIFCTDARPDAVVVYDTYNPRPGETVTDFSLYCMGPRGDVTDHGWGKVFVALTVFHTGIVLALFALGAIRSKLRQRREPTQPGGLITEA
jgi:hypothetical protein